MTLALMSFLEEKLLPPVLRVHDAVYRNTNGWIGHRTLGIPSLLLHTVGAKTGKQRTTSLTYARDGGDYLVVASKGGDPKAPGWYHNLVAHPDVTVELGTEMFGARATVIESTEWNRLGSIQLQKLPGLAELQAKITRKIPVVLLERKK